MAKKSNRDEKHRRKNWSKALTGMLVEGICFRVTEKTLGAFWELLGMESAVASQYPSDPTKCH